MRCTHTRTHRYICVRVYIFVFVLPKSILGFIAGANSHFVSRLYFSHDLLGEFILVFGLFWVCFCYVIYVCDMVLTD